MGRVIRNGMGFLLNLGFALALFTSALILFCTVFFTAVIISSTSGKQMLASFLIFGPLIVDMGAIGIFLVRLIYGAYFEKIPYKVVLDEDGFTKIFRTRKIVIRKEDILKHLRSEYGISFLLIRKGNRKVYHDLTDLSDELKEVIRNEYLSGLPEEPAKKVIFKRGDLH